MHRITSDGNKSSPHRKLKGVWRILWNCNGDFSMSTQLEGGCPTIHVLTLIELYIMLGYEKLSYGLACWQTFTISTTPNSPNCQTKLTKARVCARPIAIPPTMANSKGRALALSGDKTTKSGAFNNLYGNVREWQVSCINSWSIRNQ